MLVILIVVGGVFAEDPTEHKSSSKKKTKVIYKKHTQLDFTGGEIRGKIKTPAVYYIFQRKRAKEHHVITPVKNFNEHKKLTMTEIKKSLKP